MLSLFFVIFGSIGIFLNWPIINRGFFILLTKPWDETYLVDALHQYSSGFARPDGCIIIGLSLMILLSAFMRTTKALLNTRIVLLAIISAIVSAELFTVIRQNYSFYIYVGLLYATIFYLLAFVSAIFRFGSMKSFNSTFMGKPMSESQVFSQTFSQMMGQVARSPLIQIKAGDDMNSHWSRGEEREFSGAEVKLGRDNRWADLVIGTDWGAVSGKHGILRIIGNAMVYEPVAGHYAFGVNGKPFTSPKEIPDQSSLSLVSGLGPRMTVSYDFQKKPVIHPRTMLKVGEIARDEFKNLQTTFKILIVMVVLGMPLLWWFSAIQKKEAGDYIARIREQNIQFTRDLKEKMDRIDQMDLEGQKSQQEINRLRSRIRQLNEQDGYGQEEIQSSRDRIDALKTKAQTEKRSREINKIAKIIEIKLSSQRISVYFPFISFSGNRMVGTGTALFVKNRKGKFFVASEEASLTKGGGGTSDITAFFFIYPDSWKAFSNYLVKVKKGRPRGAELRQELSKNHSRYNLLVIDGKKWRRVGPVYRDNAIVTVPIKNLPDYLLPYIPRMDDGVSKTDRVIVYGFSSGKKIYSPADIKGLTDSMIKVRPTDKKNFSGAFLIKVQKNGHYSVAGMSHSADTGSGSGQTLFLSFR